MPDLLGHGWRKRKHLAVWWGGSGQESQERMLGCWKNGLLGPGIGKGTEEDSPRGWNLDS